MGPSGTVAAAQYLTACGIQVHVVGEGPGEVDAVQLPVPAQPYGEIEVRWIVGAVIHFEIDRLQFRLAPASRAIHRWCRLADRLGQACRR